MSGTVESVILASRELIKDSLISFAQDVNQKWAQIIEKDCINNQKQREVALELGLDLNQLRYQKELAVEHFADYIYGLEVMAGEAKVDRLAMQLLPPDYNQLFGMETAVSTLVDMLVSPSSIYAVVLTGIGGVGKSSLANAVARRLIGSNEYDRVGWVTFNDRADGVTTAHPEPVSPERMLAELAATVLPPERPTDATSPYAPVRQMLKAIPHLIILDNFEEPLSPELTGTVHDLCDPSRFILTSRMPPQSQIQQFAVSELKAKSALALIREQAQLADIMSLAGATDDELMPIFYAIGGNPLALKLVVGLCRDLTLTTVLQELKEISLDETGAMYNRIYHRAWQSISNEARQVLLSMTMTNSAVGLNEQQLAAFSNITEGALLRAIRELSQRSLLQVRGRAAGERRYTIHRLTSSFLQTEIANIPPDDLL